MPSWNRRRYCYESGWIVKLCSSFSVSLTTDCAESFGEVDRRHVSINLQSILVISIDVVVESYYF